MVSRLYHKTTPVVIEFMSKFLWIKNNHEYHENFLLRKFAAILYMVLTNTDLALALALFGWMMSIVEHLT